MSNDQDIARFVKDPSLLVEVFRHVIEELDSDSDHEAMREMGAQLREIARTIERLEKAGVPVPDALRGEKTRLASALGVKSEGLLALNQLADEMEEVLRELNTRIGRDGNRPGTSKSQGKRSRSPTKTDNKVLREHIIQALKTLGGRARGVEVIEEMGRQLEGKLLPGDLESRLPYHKYVWQGNANQQRYEMIQDGLLRSDCPRGYWQLIEDHR
jgi:hypothetical protein